MLATSSSLVRHNQTFLKTLFQSASASSVRNYSVAFNVKTRFEDAFNKKVAGQTVKKEYVNILILNLFSQEAEN